MLRLLFDSSNKLKFVVKKKSSKKEKKYQYELIWMPEKSASWMSPLKYIFQPGWDPFVNGHEEFA